MGVTVIKKFYVILIRRPMRPLTCNNAICPYDASIDTSLHVVCDINSRGRRLGFAVQVATEA
jgi:hypothetical protein